MYAIRSYYAILTDVKTGAKMVVPTPAKTGALVGWRDRRFNVGLVGVWAGYLCLLLLVLSYNFV